MSPLGLLTTGLFFWSGLMRIGHGPMLTPAPVVRFSSLQNAAVEIQPVTHSNPTAVPIGTVLVPRLVATYDGDDFMRAMFYIGPPNARIVPMLAEFASVLADEANLPGRFGGEPFERKVFDFGRRCLNTCALGGWGSCAVETRAKQDECEGIAGRTIVSAAARRAPLVRDVLKLVGSRTTALPTDVDAGLRLSTGLIRGGGTLGIEARW